MPLVGGAPSQSHPIMQHASATPLSPNSSVTGLPSNWEVRMDPRTQRWYYVNHNTRTTHWSLPPEIIAAIPLPARWEARTDQKTGRLYYLNHNNRTTHWDYPLASNPSSLPASPSPASGARPAPGHGDARVTELVSMGFARDVAAAVASSNKQATVPELVEFILLRAKQQGHDVPLPERPPSPTSGSPSSSTSGAVDESKLCKICMEREIDVVILKCGHMCVCRECGLQLRTCPICRGQISELIRIFQC